MFNQEKEKYQLNDAQIYSKCIKKLFPTTQFGQWSKVSRKVQVKYASILNSLTMNIQKSLEETPIFISKKGLNRNKEIAFGILFKNAVKELNINLLPKLKIRVFITLVKIFIKHRIVYKE